MRLTKRGERVRTAAVLVMLFGSALLGTFLTH